MNSSKGMVAGIAGAVLLLAIPMLIVVAFWGSDEDKPKTTGCGGSSLRAAGSGKAVGSWSAQQVSNAAAIINAGAQMGVPAQGQRIAVMTAIGESTLQVLGYGDAAGPDSRGLFQQRGNGAWGSLQDRMDPAKSASSFYRALLKVSGWQSMEPSLAAHAVQHNADPYHYERFWSQAVDLVSKISTGAGAGPDGETAGAIPGVVDAVGPDGESADPSTTAGCGGGAFSTNAAAGYVGPYNVAQLLARAQQFVAAGPSDPFFGSVSTWYRACQHFVANLSGRATSGFTTASSAWAHFTAIGTAHPAAGVDGMAPPPGAWLYYSGVGAAGHVAVYLGNGQVAGTDTWGRGRVGIGPASDITSGKWHLTYLGWAAPWGTPVQTKAPAGTTPAGTATGGLGSVVMAQANIPQRSGMAGYQASMKRVLAKSPDFITLNEMQQRTMSQVVSGAPGYAGYRDPHVGKDPGAGQSLDTVVLWKAATWSPVAAGRVKIVEDDRNNYQGHLVTWDRFATYVTLKRRTDGATVSVVSVHHMTDPAKYGPDKPGRQAQYGLGMDTLLQTTNGLESSGPVLVGGDFNVPASQADRWAAPSKMSAAGYGWANTGVDYLFAPAGTARVEASWNGPMVSDHRWLAARIGFTS